MEFSFIIISPPCGPISCHQSMVCPQVTDGGDGFQMGAVAVNILNNQSRAADKGVVLQPQLDVGQHLAIKQIELVMTCH
jgi:hypothetical protein